MEPLVLSYNSAMVVLRVLMEVNGVFNNICSVSTFTLAYFEVFT